MQRVGYMTIYAIDYGFTYGMMVQLLEYQVPNDVIVGVLGVNMYFELHCNIKSTYFRLSLSRNNWVLPYRRQFAPFLVIHIEFKWSISPPPPPPPFQWGSSIITMQWLPTCKTSSKGLFFSESFTCGSKLTFFFIEHWPVSLYDVIVHGNDSGPFLCNALFYETRWCLKEVLINWMHFKFQSGRHYAKTARHGLVTC